MDIESKDRIARIRVLNDAFRQMFVGGRVMITCGVAELPGPVKARALQLVASYDKFTEDNDPHNEQDFGSFELANQKFFWKIDLYEEPDVNDANGEPVVTRVLTLMLAEEY